MPKDLTPTIDGVIQIFSLFALKMTIPEFLGCACIAYGLPLALFVHTIAHDPVRIIILIAAAFFWLLSLLASSLIWFAVVPLRDKLAFGLVFSVFIQEGFRYIVYRILRRTEQGLQLVAENSSVTDNKHILAYVSGLGFGTISGIFALVNVLADMTGPATMGLEGGSALFLMVSALLTFNIVALHTSWSVIFFNALDTNRYLSVTYVVGTHLFNSLLTLLNESELYLATLIPSTTITILTSALAMQTAGVTWRSFKRFITCQ